MPRAERARKRRANDSTNGIAGSATLRAQSATIVADSVFLSNWRRLPSHWKIYSVTSKLCRWARIARPNSCPRSPFSFPYFRSLTLRVCSDLVASARILDRAKVIRGGIIGLQISRSHQRRQRLFPLPQLEADVSYLRSSHDSSGGKRFVALLT